MRSIANNRLFLLRPESFLLHASNILGFSVSSESVRDVRRVTEARTRAQIRRLVWRTAGGRCSLCRAFLTTIRSGSESSLAQFCHIKAQAPGGQRFDPGAQDRNDYENLILLCANCHMHVDSPNGGYTAEQLHQIKTDHEAWISENPEEAAQVNVTGSLRKSKVAEAGMVLDDLRRLRSVPSDDGGTGTSGPSRHGSWHGNGRCGLVLRTAVPRRRGAGGDPLGDSERGADGPCEPADARPPRGRGDQPTGAN
jgi:5-methylcytosine-specific restriction endonuclease McrA